MKEPTYNFDPETTLSTYTIYYNDKEFTGHAKCVEEDKSRASDRTGLFIAETKATIKYLKFIKTYMLQPRLDASLQLYFAMNQSKQFNPKSYENRMLQRQIRNYQDDIALVKETIKNVTRELKKIGHIKLKINN